MDLQFSCQEVRPSGYVKLPPRQTSAECVVCQASFQYVKIGAGRLRRFCSDRCRDERVRRALRTIDCTSCGKPFFPARRWKGRPDSHGKFCSLTCRPQVVLKKIHASRDEQRRAGKQRRWARRHATEIERFKDEEIFERDGWQCKICFKPVNKKLKFPHRMAASLDHIVPVSKGGSHTRRNTQCSHWLCNSRKGNRGQDQLRLF